MAKSDNLRKAKEAKNDEFYTRLEDIEAEISQHDDYVRQFQGKTVLCNCDDPEWSNFFVFFKLHFKQLGLKKLITTHYNMDGSPSYKLEWEGEMLNDDMVNLIKTPLKGNGDFRSEECIEILKEADIVSSNPPFSIAREAFIPQLIEYKKKFVIIGDLNWVAYKTVFPLFKENKMFFGYTNVKEFKTPNGTYQKFGNKTWFTNFDLDKSHEPLILTKNYKGNESRYPKYDNYDAIECGKVKDIPKDYFPCWYNCPHAASCIYAQTEGKEDKALCEIARASESSVKPASGFTDEEEANTIDMKNASMECLHGMTPWNASMECLHGMPPWNASREEPGRLESRSHSSAVLAENNSESLESTDTLWTIRTRESASCSTVRKCMRESLFADCHKCNGIIGVPITFLADFCQEQFRIIGSGTGDKAKELGIAKNYRGRTDLSLTTNGKQSCPYNRILIQRMHKM